MFEIRDPPAVCSKCHLCGPTEEEYICEKVGETFLFADPCEENHSVISQKNFQKTARHNNRSYRRHMKFQKDKRRKRIVSETGYNPSAGWLSEKGYLMYPKNSNRQRFYKHYSCKRVRKEDLPHKGNGYRKVFGYKWEIY